MLVLGDEGRQRLGDVALDELDFADVAEKAIRVVLLDEFEQLAVAIRLEIARLRRTELVRVLRVHQGKTLECVKPIDPSREILWFEHRAQLRPRHESEALVYATFDDRAFDG